MVQASSDDFRNVRKVRTKSTREPLTEQPVGMVQSPNFPGIVDPCFIQKRLYLLVILKGQVSPWTGRIYFAELTPWSNRITAPYSGE